jgi:hypothetical protein
MKHKIEFFLPFIITSIFEIQFRSIEYRITDSEIPTSELITSVIVLWVIKVGFDHSRSFELFEYQSINHKVQFNPSCEKMVGMNVILNQPLLDYLIKSQHTESFLCLLLKIILLAESSFIREPKTAITQKSLDPEFLGRHHLQAI